MTDLPLIHPTLSGSIAVSETSSSDPPSWSCGSSKPSSDRTKYTDEISQACNNLIDHIDSKHPCHSQAEWAFSRVTRDLLNEAKAYSYDPSDHSRFKISDQEWLKRRSRIIDDSGILPGIPMRVEEYLSRTMSSKSRSVRGQYGYGGTSKMYRALSGFDEVLDYLAVQISENPGFADRLNRGYEEYLEKEEERSLAEEKERS
ncbi:hypothetical protein I302_103050 [Kwoniella bestiolae CBS 10118]|uniref:Uncharacterized protein n=1 Tax=Kwoniella bestiolae CBS 10118 TaxID=1296100 RepID=A0A1B9GGW6_9TREE|nr:hypothetical protein I302_01747 [Kwoniella bestiolae CBS 10118]OCF30228.1 hypothetical protein I302_01747 [Kwoniella bestiolae CBS 10118]